MQGLLLYLKKRAHLYCYKTTILFNFLCFFHICIGNCNIAEGIVTYNTFNCLGYRILTSDIILDMLLIKQYFCNAKDLA